MLLYPMPAVSPSISPPVPVGVIPAHSTHAAVTDCQRYALHRNQHAENSRDTLTGAPAMVDATCDGDHQGVLAGALSMLDSIFEAFWQKLHLRCPQALLTRSPGQSSCCPRGHPAATNLRNKRLKRRKQNPRRTVTRPAPASHSASPKIPERAADRRGAQREPERLHSFPDFTRTAPKVPDQQTHAALWDSVLPVAGIG
ncbi:Hypothetical predicted protein [Pelobates cultripes]|uniref:Uncharacterized protein n=1 Tax=Pelobates cultripes TaxID=61616 RepID=A0AAD1WLW1_PELCU|nr:Hypothetical predicted protein [Pelobates cultripes]